MTAPSDWTPDRVEALAQAVERLREAVVRVTTEGVQAMFGPRLSPVQATGTLHEAAAALRALAAENERLKARVDELEARLFQADMELDGYAMVEAELRGRLADEDALRAEYNEKQR